MGDELLDVAENLNRADKLDVPRMGNGMQGMVPIISDRALEATAKIISGSNSVVKKMDKNNLCLEKEILKNCLAVREKGSENTKLILNTLAEGANDLNRSPEERQACCSMMKELHDSEIEAEKNYCDSQESIMRERHRHQIEQQRINAATILLVASVFFGIAGIGVLASPVMVNNHK